MTLLSSKNPGHPSQNCLIFIIKCYHPAQLLSKTKHSKWFHLLIIKNLLKNSNVSDDILGAGTDMKKNKTRSLHLKTRTGDVFMTSTFDKVEECDQQESTPSGKISKNGGQQSETLQAFQTIWELSPNALRQCFSRFRKHESHLECDKVQIPVPHPPLTIASSFGTGLQNGISITFPSNAEVSVLETTLWEPLSQGNHCT